MTPPRDLDHAVVIAGSPREVLPQAAQNRRRMRGFADAGSAESIQPLPLSISPLDVIGTVPTRNFDTFFDERHSTPRWTA
jgi:hypothetical protein